MKYLILVVCLSVGACGGPDPDESTDTETVFDPLVENIDKAEAVEQQVLDQKSALDRAIEQQEVGDEADDE